MDLPPEAGGFLRSVEEAVGLIFFSFFGGLIRSIYRPRSRKLSAYFVSIVVSVPIGVLAGNISIEFGLSPNIAKAIAVIAGIVAHDIIESIFWTVDRLKQERESFFQFIIKRIFGDKNGQKP